MRIAILLSMLVCLSACTNRASFEPDGDSLEDAVVGQSYDSMIHIVGGAVFSLDLEGMKRFVGVIYPNNIGLSLEYCDDSPAKNCVRVKGIPTKAGVVKVRVSGGLFGNNFSSGSSFDKTYTLIVKSADGTP